MNQQVIAAEKFIWERLFCPETNLLYEVDFTPDENGFPYAELPTPEEIADVFPNPCGWGTEMEDGVLNGCILLDSVIDRYDSEKREECRAEAATLWKGLRLCATVSASPGFLARSVSPYDGKSHYIDSSVDQYTHFIYSGLHYYHSALADEAARNEIRAILVAFAARAEKNVKPENGWNMLREDGYPAVITYFDSPDMLYTGIYRLAMIYAAAWSVTGDDHWKALYDKSKKRDVIPPFPTFNDVYIGTLTNRMCAYCILQSQLSLRVCHDVEPDADFRKVLFAGLRSHAEMAVHYIPFIVRELRDWKYNYYLRPHTPWRREIIRYHFWYKTYAGHPFVIPEWPEEETKTIMPPREAGEALTIQCLCPGFVIDSAQFEGAMKIVEKLDFDRYERSSAVQFVGGCRAYQHYLSVNEKHVRKG